MLSLFSDDRHAVFASLHLFSVVPEHLTDQGEGRGVFCPAYRLRRWLMGVGMDKEERKESYSVTEIG